MTHSQGPWVIQGDNIVVDGFTIGGINIEDAEKRPEEAKANLALMASAPELLEALESALGVLESEYSHESEDSDYFKQLRSVIAKAKGGIKR